MNLTYVIDKFGDAIYLALTVLAIWGFYNVIMLYRGLRKKSLTTEAANQLLGEVGDLARAGQMDKAIAACQVPRYWHSALAQLTAVALKHRDKGIAKVKQLLVTEFHSEIVSVMENRLASIGTAARTGPLLGLLGTVASMIAAFGKMGGGEKADPQALASAISIGLWATAAGLLIATPLMTLGNDIHARLRVLRDRTERQLQDLIEILEGLDGPSSRGDRARSASRAARPR